MKKVCKLVEVDAMMSIGRFALALSAALIVMLVTAPASWADRRALLIGVAAYQHVHPLDNPPTDVKNLAAKLREADYIVTTVTDPDATREKLLLAVDGFLQTIKQGDDVLVYYSGHGVDINGMNLIVPADSPSSEDIHTPFALSQQLISMRSLMTEIEDHQPAVQIWIIDACRENPYADGGRPYAAQGGLSKFDEQPGLFILFAAKYSQIARDTLRSDPPGSHLGSPFSRVLTRLFDTWKDKDINLFASQARRDLVRLVSPDPQFPTYENGLIDQWCFVTCSKGVEKVELASNVPQELRNSEATIKIKQPNSVTMVFTPNQSPGNASSPDLSQLIGGRAVVFLGKESSRSCVPGNVSDFYPFGCRVLQQLSAHFGSDATSAAGGLVGEAVTAETLVNVRRGLPKPAAGGTTASNDCKVATFKPGTSIRLVSTVALKYANDTFYWGAVDGVQPVCAPVVYIQYAGPGKNGEVSLDSLTYLNGLRSSLLQAGYEVPPIEPKSYVSPNAHTLYYFNKPLDEAAGKIVATVNNYSSTHGGPKISSNAQYDFADKHREGEMSLQIYLH